MKLKLFSAAAAVFLLFVSPVFAVIPPAENLLPADTLLMLTVPDWSRLSATAQQSPQCMMWCDPAMKPFRDHFTAKWNEKFAAPMEQSLGIQIDDYLPLLQGQLTFAITQNGWDGSDGSSPAMVLLLDAKGKSDLLATNLAALKQSWRNSGKPVRTEVLQDIKFSVVTLSTNSPLPSSPVSTSGSSSMPKTIYIGQYQSLLILGTSVKVVESVAAHLTGGANPALRNNAQFAADNLSQFHDGPLYYGWFNAKAFVSVLSQLQPPTSDTFPIPWDKVLVASGLQGLRSVSFSYHETHDGAQVEFLADVPESTRDGLFKIITAAPKDANPPPFVPADAVKFWRWRVDGQKSWAELQKMLMGISPSAIGTLTTFLAMANANAQQQDPNFDITKDLIGNLGDDWMSFGKAPPGASTLQNVNSGPWLFLFAANNPEQAARAIKTVAGMASPDGTPQTRDFLGRKIYTIQLPAHGTTGANGAAPAPSSIYCTASGGYVALAMDVSMIENFLRSDDGKTKPLSQTPGLVEAAQHVGGMGNGLFGYQNQRETARTLFGALKNDPTAASVTLNPLAVWPSAAGGSSFKDLMDFSLLPDYDKIAKYFNFTVYGGSSTSEGLDLKVYTPRPPGLN
jgi:hypothetical protein